MWMAGRGPHLREQGWLTIAQLGNLLGQGAAVQSRSSVSVCCGRETGLARNCLPRVSITSPCAGGPFGDQLRGLPSRLLESELSWLRGRRVHRRGRRRQARPVRNGLTVPIFSTKSSEISRSIQARMLRVLQERKLRLHRWGSGHQRKHSGRDHTKNLYRQVP